MRIGILAAVGVVAAGVAGAAAAEEPTHFRTGFEMGCLAHGDDPLSIPIALFEDHYWSLYHGPDTGEFELLRGDSQVFVTTFGARRCVVTTVGADRAAAEAMVEAALESRHPGEWSREEGPAGPLWRAIVGDAPVEITIIEELSGPGLGVDLRS
ncbi:MAG: hypothetical protein AAGF90_16340 [Pseudomonadota bacterium]